MQSRVKSGGEQETLSSAVSRPNASYSNRNDRESLFWLLPSSLAGFLPNEDIVTSLVYYDSLCVISRQVTKLKGQARELEKREQQRDYRRHPVIYLEKSRFLFFVFFQEKGRDRHGIPMRIIHHKFHSDSFVSRRTHRVMNSVSTRRIPVTNENHVPVRGSIPIEPGGTRCRDLAEM